MRSRLEYNYLTGSISFDAAPLYDVRYNYMDTCDGQCCAFKTYLCSTPFPIYCDPYSNFGNVTALWVAKETYVLAEHKSIMEIETSLPSAPCFLESIACPAPNVPIENCSNFVSNFSTGLEAVRLENGTVWTVDQQRSDTFSLFYFAVNNTCDIYSVRNDVV